MLGDGSDDAVEVGVGLEPGDGETDGDGEADGEVGTFLLGTGIVGDGVPGMGDDVGGSSDGTSLGFLTRLPDLRAEAG
ncbi:MAG: hypothetical protein EON52_07910 [Actinomycetales bacterium]|nr:MAG: hypothetical protein EON52_07910 [Actinomycetales bacterium]